MTDGTFGYLLDYMVWCVLLLSLLVHTWCFFRWFPRRRRPRAALVVGNGLMFLCLLAIGAWAGETFLRFTYVATDSFGVSLPARRWFALYTSLNSAGCRDKEWIVPRPQHTNRIAFIGDSFTYGWGVDNVKDRFTDRLQSMFDAQKPHAVEVMNVAKPGWNTGDEIQPLKDMIDVYGADEVVLCYVPNDIEDLLPTTNRFNPTRPPEPTFFNPDSSCLLDYFYRTMILPRSPSVSGYFDWLARGYADAKVWKNESDRLGELIQYCQLRSVKMRVILLPYIRSGGTEFNEEGVHSRMRQFLNERSVQVADLLPIVKSSAPAELVVNRNDPHPNATAHHLFADAIWKAFYSH
ncbi:MAG: SGNH/GDSL hydrolase family protein [Planctomycetes bacterium]|nr:SGNH/GDSL hydrolase family protein [Planctomycetota bacterium]